ncbi:hypothetical protein PG994_009951 [Apiospora phragmitis]|uniref:Rhodopsin domain-containing protein n=1 Tax=Apiospora phragmitis TaxID=2905665 RepID=A0ABR1TNI8_9PEZI
MIFTPGLKTPQEFVSTSKYGFFAIPIWGLAMAFIKSSIGLTLLQIKTSFWFQVYIWFNIVLMSLYGFGNLFFILLQCRPLPAAYGDFAHAGPNPHCLPPVAITIASTLGAVASILTDVLLSLAPLSFLWSLRRPKRERVRDLANAAFLPPEKLATTDFGAKAVYVCIWTALEQLLGVVAACTPFCKPLFERGLGVVLGSLHLPLSIIKPSRGTATTSSFGDYDRTTAQDHFRTSKVTSAGGYSDGRGGEAGHQALSSRTSRKSCLSPSRWSRPGSGRWGAKAGRHSAHRYPGG